VYVGVAQDWWGPGSGEKVELTPASNNNESGAGKGKGKDVDSPVRTFIGKRSVLFAPLAPPSKTPPPAEATGAEVLFSQDQAQQDPGPLVMQDGRGGGGGEYNEPPWTGVNTSVYGQEDMWYSCDSAAGGSSMQINVELDEAAIEKAIRASLGALCDRENDVSLTS